MLAIDILTHVSDAENARKFLRQLKHITREERRNARDERERKRQELSEGIQERKPLTDFQRPPDQGPEQS